jgi:uncharacterized protein with HEPN domain
LEIWWQGNFRFSPDNSDLYDIKLAIEEIDSFFSSRLKRYEEYADDIMLKRAIERDLEIIGEAINRILRVC